MFWLSLMLQGRKQNIAMVLMGGSELQYRVLNQGISKWLSYNFYSLGIDIWWQKTPLCRGKISSVSQNGIMYI